MLRYFVMSSLCALGAGTAFAKDPVLDRSLNPATDSNSNSDTVSTVFKDMGVVQNQAMHKGGKIVLSQYVGMDFSDGPYSMYSLNFDVGFAISDFWEVYINTVPYFINSKRSIVSKVESLTLANGQQATLTSALAQHQLGFEVLWAPLYGKDSLGARHIIRSDTFIKAGASVIQYDIGNGLKYHLGVGKTYFLTNRLGARFTVSGNYIQTILDAQKSFQPVVMVEAGLTWYLL